MVILGIETSCDETAAAVVRDGREVLASVVFSQAEMHGPYGGVVPEIASRSHVETLPTVTAAVLQRSGLDWGDLDGIAVTYGPGLASSLLVGLSGAKGLALRLGCPLIAVNHLEAHIYSAFLGEGAPAFADRCPLTALIVSGGHTSLVHVEAPGHYRLLGQTIDDAAGEAFDKGANLLGLGYPGGPAIDKIAREGDRGYVRFPRGRQREYRSSLQGLDPQLCFSFSGLKTSLLYYLKEHPHNNDRGTVASLAASYQEAIVDALVSRCERAVPRGQSLAVVGGVSLNSRLRERLLEMASSRSVSLLLAEARFCADNAAMIAGLASLGQGIRGDQTLEMDVNPNATIGLDKD